MDWSEIRPVLEATYHLLDDNERVSQQAVCEALGRPAEDQQTIRALALLYQSGHIDGMTVNQSPAPIFITATTKGLQETRGWPREDGGADQLDLLLRLLDERIAAEDTPEEKRGKLMRIRDGIASLGRDFAVDLLAAYVARASGIG